MSGEPHVTRTPATDPVARELASNRSTAAQWFGIAGGPVAMLGNLQAEYVLVSWACYGGAAFVLHVVPALFLAISVAAAVVARREWRRAGVSPAPPAALSRARFLGALGVAMSLFFAVIIAAMWLADAFLNPCHGT